jgi:putative restriction endonuclease
VVRDTATVRRIKALHDYRCQLCGIRIETPAGPFAEGAHIRPLGRPHNGPDSKDNILCLCPNHHVLFDTGAITVSGNFEVLGLPRPTKLRLVHDLNAEHLRYHREHIGVLVPKVQY